ncbi:MAG: hypothetical protein HZA24_02370 [Nitrospirae bacterium]|nr:hypothetical protein [Nitrospirota bacterium]
MKKYRAGWAAAVALGLVVSVGPAFAADDAAAPAPKAPKKMVVNGMSSGVLRLPVITIWECPGGAQGGCNPAGEVKHGVEVVRDVTETARGLKWAHITGDGINGWILAELLSAVGT